ncbi:hypothetical protein HK099_004324 [Clydaea vesicula]|uniref:Uncharacterized protein n=1 Tax=Clydaea vesicula TaxID=447962 RepID=A0AAD5UAT6_9FUNG|nr:hypothetical protein HK099_004324 [Clydaea vesicula]
MNNDAATNVIWTAVNQGWEVVKLLEFVIIPYGYFLLRPNRIAKLLFYSTIIAFIHNLLAFTAIYIEVLHVEINTFPIWFTQAMSAGIIRCIELYVNYILVNIIINSKAKKVQTMLQLVTVVAMIGVLAGRLYDSLGVEIFSFGKVRVGMAIVSLFGLLQEFWIFDNLDNSRTLLLFMDLVFTRLVANTEKAVESKTEKNKKNSIQHCPTNTSGDSYEVPELCTSEVTNSTPVFNPRVIRNTEVRKAVNV